MTFGSSRSVSRSPDFRRIQRLERRDFEPDLCGAVINRRLRTAMGTETLRPVQVQALYEIEKYRGLFGPIQVGAGKTLISLLAPTVLEARRPLLLIPAALIEKTNRDRREKSRHWKVAPNLRITSYELLGRVQSADFLARYKPDLIIADEAHRLKNHRAGCTRRVERWMDEYPETMFVAMSGTIMPQSFLDICHLLEWTHKERSPAPRDKNTQIEWAAALDRKVNPLARYAPGALLELGDDSSDDSVEGARKAFFSRLAATPGVVMSNGTGPPCALNIRALEYTPKPITDTHFRTLRSTWETPDGWALSEAVEVWRAAKQLALGMCYVWDPRPPDEWLIARKDWAKYVREFLSSQDVLDTELQVSQFVRERGGIGRLLFDRWMGVKPTFTINSKSIWHDDSALVACEKWGLARKSGIIWCEHTFFAEELAKRTGWTYFGANGTDATGRSIESSNGLIIASIAANATGRNLQKWSENLITSVPDPKGMEQLLGRTHREGQESDEVNVDILVGCFEHLNGFEQAMNGARMSKDMIGHTQKLLIATIDMPDLVGRLGPRWER